MAKSAKSNLTLIETMLDPSKFDPAQLMRRFGNLLVRDKIHAYYQKLAAASHELATYKKAHNICYRGFSCMRPIAKGGACTHHYSAIKSGIKLTKLNQYFTEYATLERYEREKNTTQSKRKTKVTMAAKKNKRAA